MLTCLPPKAYRFIGSSLEIVGCRYSSYSRPVASAHGMPKTTRKSHQFVHPHSIFPTASQQRRVSEKRELSFAFRLGEALRAGLGFRVWGLRV